MGDATGISWTDATWNPVRGCSRVSAGCQRCYAEVQAARIVRMGKGKPTAYDGLVRVTAGGDPRWTGEIRLDAKALELPLRWSRPRRIFANSMSDLFHENLSDDAIDQVLAVMLLSPRHTFQVLTKRAERMRRYFEAPDLYQRVLDAAGRFRAARPQLNQIAIENPSRWPARWIWLGISVENQEAADERIPELLRTPAAVRFLSCEPLLGPVELRNIDAEKAGHEDVWFVDALTGKHDDMGRPCSPLPRLDWIIAGCESGPGARPCSVEWLRSLRDQCTSAGVAFFLKQAEHTPGVFVPVDSLGRRCSATLALGADTGSKPKGKGPSGGRIVELPYLDGVQHAAFPNVERTIHG